MREMERPQLRIEHACRSLGRETFISRCHGLLSSGDESPDFIVILGGAHAIRLLDDRIPSGQRYWLRVWAARGLLWAGPGDDLRGLRKALADDAWRVREMMCKVIARHRVGDVLSDVARLESDPVLRVRKAASRAVMRIVEDKA